MRHAVLALLVLAGCASGATQESEVSIHLEQLTPGANFRFAGPVNVEYRVTVSNPTGEPVTLGRIDLRTIGPAAYVLSTPSQPMNLKVPARDSASMVITALGSALGGRNTSVEPVTVRATAYFDGPKGAFVRVVNETFRQLGRE